MKKIFIFIISIVCLFSFTGCDDSESMGTTGGYTTYKRISYDRFVELKEDGKSFPLVIGASTCSACQMFEVTMESFIQKNDIQVYFIDLDEVSDEERVNLLAEVNFSSTPTTVFYKDGQLVSAIPDNYENHWGNGIKYLVGAGSMQSVKDLYTSNGYDVK